MTASETSDNCRIDQTAEMMGSSKYGLRGAKTRNEDRAKCDSGVNLTAAE